MLGILQMSLRKPRATEKHLVPQSTSNARDHEAVVVAHITIDMAAPIAPVADVGQPVQPIRSIFVVAIDHLAAIASEGHMVEPASELNAQRPGHDRSLNQECLIARPDPSDPRVKSRDSIRR